MGSRTIHINGIPSSAPPAEAALLRARLIRHSEEFISRTNVSRFAVTVTSNDDSDTSAHADPRTRIPTKNDDQLTVEQIADSFKAREPEQQFTLDRLVAPDGVKRELQKAIRFYEVLPKLREWGIGEIDPHPKKVLFLVGRPGTGKTFSAHAIANAMGRKILMVSYAQVGSQYMWKPTQNIEAAFTAASRDDAVLMFDECDSLLKTRFTSVNQGSEHAINSMVNQILQCLDRFEGIVIFASNVTNTAEIDEAFLNRSFRITFPYPDVEARRQIWKMHIPKALPLAEHVSFEALADIDGMSGREIRDAVIDAMIDAAMNARPCVTADDLRSAALRLRRVHANANSQNLPSEVSQAVVAKCKAQPSATSDQDVEPENRSGN